MAHIELALHERQVIEEMLLAKASVASIAGKLSRHRSTIYREIKVSARSDRPARFVECGIVSASDNGHSEALYGASSQAAVDG